VYRNPAAKQDRFFFYKYTLTITFTRLTPNQKLENDQFDLKFPEAALSRP
jgi:outer membrane lipoprotein-sorting protein